MAAKPPETLAPVPPALPQPRSPPKYPDICGRHRLQVEAQILNREILFLENIVDRMDERFNLYSFTSIYEDRGPTQPLSHVQAPTPDKLQLMVNLIATCEVSKLLKPDFKQEELQSLEEAQPVSRCCNEYAPKFDQTFAAISHGSAAHALALSGSENQDNVFLII
ncbi:hypothetical protein MA16_Dca005800 [Dendrobium catenatum]|uniref:Uncharacterized protein n=1 Tax=Dendrobium catenatum TaxID=906689 RepID=A0A2I0WX80_9ASPA|nr:hypothetical protein MA16_Dca005800 [Dendrobium catenatum]